MKFTLFTSLLMAVAIAIQPAQGADWERLSLPDAKVKAGETHTVALPEGCREFVIEAELELRGNLHGHALDGKGWRIELLDGFGAPLKRMSLVYRTRGAGLMGDDKRVAECTVEDLRGCEPADGQTETPESRLTIDDESSVYCRVSEVAVENVGDRAGFWAGEKGSVYGGEGHFAQGVKALTISGDRDLRLRHGVLKWRPAPDAALRSGLSAEEIAESCQNESQAEPVGMWQFLDRDTESSLAEPGGRYILAVVKHRAAEGASDTVESDYDIIYMGGGVANRSAWEPGMIKGLLWRTSFAGHYRAEWIDADMEPMDGETFADLTADGAILSVNFPLYRSTIRFERMPNP